MLSRNLLALACATLLLSACAPQDRPTITVSGSSTIAPLMAEIGKGFEAQHPDVRVDVQAGGTSRGIQDARSGLAAIGMASRSLHTDEQDLTPFIIAQDGIAMIVHASNPLAGISSGCVLDSGPAEQLFASVRDSLAHRYLNGMLC